MSDDTWDYSDEQAQMILRIAALERQLTALRADLDALKDGVQRAAEYQGVKHLLAPQ